MTTDVRRIDWGRLAFTPIMAVLGAGQALRTVHAFGDPALGDVAAAAAAVRDGLMLAFYVLIIGCYVLRGSPLRSDASRVHNVLAVVATFLPFALGAVTRTTTAVELSVLGSVLITGGVAWSVWSLRHLGDSLSVIAQSRRLVQTGPYRWVRHPLYLGELVAAAGAVVSGPTVAGALLWVLLVALQWTRLRREETILASTFAEYQSYRAATWPLVPGLR